jgi:erythronate-4-phosphate dehydrogenase
VERANVGQLGEHARLIPQPTAARYDAAVRIVSDRNIPFVEEAFAALGEVRTLAAAEIDAAAVRDADLLLCRSTIKVGPALLDGSKVRFVATATIGSDHLDLPYLARRGIPWASAPGSNADSVALWWTCALAALARRRNIDPTALRVGVVGVGHVGGRVAAIARALGHEPVLCDPPRARVEGLERTEAFVEIDELLERCDVVSLHVPLADEGPDATRGLLNAARLGRLRPGAVLINTCRGEVVDGDALREVLMAGRAHALLDVFPGEPAPDPALIAAAEIATPHIAGHSLDGKVNGTDAIYRAACAFLGRSATFDVHARLESLADEPRLVPTHHRSDAEVLELALRPFYEIDGDDAALRAIAAKPAGERAAAFRAYRDTYPVRREPRGVRMRLEPRRARLAAVLERLGLIVLPDGR